MGHCKGTVTFLYAHLVNWIAHLVNRIAHLVNRIVQRDVQRDSHFLLVTFYCIRRSHKRRRLPSTTFMTRGAS